jgi:ACS family sodium-dependent inorganic phosphate cotransporter
MNESRSRFSFSLVFVRTISIAFIEHNEPKMSSRHPRRRRLAVALSLLFTSFGGHFATSFQTKSPFHAKTSIQYSRPTAISLLQKTETLNFTVTTLLEPKQFQDGSVPDCVPDQGKAYQVQSQGVDDSMIFVMMTLIFAIGSLSSLDRVAMSVALVPMSQDFGYTDTLKGSISSFFSVGYGLGIVPSGLLLTSVSPRIIMAAGIALWSAGTLATPFAAGQANMAFLLSARALVGASESVVIPTIQIFLSNWVPADKKGLAVAIVFAGFQSGTILAYSLSPSVIDQFGGDWRSVFYLYGGVGFLFLIPWLSLSKDSPTTSDISMEQPKFTSEQPTEKSALETARTVIASAPWKGFAQSKGVWAMFLAHAANNWGLYNTLSWTPTFYAEQYGLNVKESAVLLVVPSIVGAIGGLGSGIIADNMIRNLEVPSDEAVTRIRKLFQGIALFGPAVCLTILALDIPEEPWVAQTLLAGTVGMQSFNAAGYGAANQEKAGEKWTGLLYSITSLPSVMIGTFSVYLTGRLLDLTDQNWSYIFGINSIVFALGAAAFVTLYDSQKEFD